MLCGSSVLCVSENNWTLCYFILSYDFIMSYATVIGQDTVTCSSALYKYYAIVQKWVPYSQRYLFNAIPDTNHNANPTNPNRYSKGNPNPTNPDTRYRCE